MGKRKVVRAMWGVGALVLGAALLAGRPLVGQKVSYWVARYRGEGANLAGGNFEGADLSRANLKKANLRGATLAKARCFETNLRGADLRGANLRASILAGADLRWARLEGAKLTGAVYDHSTRWPKGFIPKNQGAVPAHWDAKVWRALGRPVR